MEDLKKKKEALAKDAGDAAQAQLKVGAPRSRQAELS
jgi:hypothetical protein